MKYRHRNKPSVQVEFVAEAEYRIGEMRSKAIIYTRNQKFYVRGKGEFFKHFEELPTSV